MTTTFSFLDQRLGIIPDNTQKPKDQHSAEYEMLYSSFCKPGLMKNFPLAEVFTPLELSIKFPQYYAGNFPYVVGMSMSTFMDMYADQIMEGNSLDIAIDQNQINYRSAAIILLNHQYVNLKSITPMRSYHTNNMENLISDVANASMDLLKPKPTIQGIGSLTSSTYLNDSYEIGGRTGYNIHSFQFEFSDALRILNMR